MPTRRAAALLGTVAVLLSACGGGGDGDYGTVDEEGNVSVDGVNRLDDGQLSVCSDIPYPPFEWDRDGETTGFDPAVLAAVGDRLGVEVTWMPTPFIDIPAALEDGDCDVAASAITATEAFGQANLTEAYAEGDQALLVRVEDQATFGSLADLAGEPIGVREGSAAAALVAEQLPDGSVATEVPVGADLLSALARGDVAGLVMDAPVAALRQADEPDRFVVVETFPTASGYVLATGEQSKSLLKVLDVALGELREAGTLDELRNEWLEDPGE